MKIVWTAATFRVISIFLIVADESCCCHTEGSPHCDVTTPKENRRMTLNVTRTRAITVEEPYNDYQWLDACFHGGHVNINWEMSQTMLEGSNVKLCYRIEIIERTIKQCFIVHVPPLDRPVRLFCCINMANIEERPLIETQVTYRERGQHHYFYGPVKDICTDPCVPRVANFSTVVYVCGITSRVRHVQGVSIEQLNFTATNATVCQNIRLNFTRTNETELEFSLNCAYNGLGEIGYLYNIRGHYCFKNMPVRLFCETDTPMSAQSESSNRPMRPQLRSTIFLVVSITTIIAMSIALAVVIVAIRKQRLRGRSGHAQETRLQNREEFQRIRLNGHIGDIEEDVDQ